MDTVRDMGLSQKKEDQSQQLNTLYFCTQGQHWFANQFINQTSIKLLTRSTSVNSSCTDLYERKLSDSSGANGPARGVFNGKERKGKKGWKSHQGLVPRYH